MKIPTKMMNKYPRSKVAPMTLAKEVAKVPQFPRVADRKVAPKKNIPAPKYNRTADKKYGEMA